MGNIFLYRFLDIINEISQKVLCMYVFENCYKLFYQKVLRHSKEL